MGMFPTPLLRVILLEGSAVQVLGSGRYDPQHGMLQSMLAMSQRAGGAQMEGQVHRGNGGRGRRLQVLPFCFTDTVTCCWEWHMQSLYTSFVVFTLAPVGVQGP
jgi:hypothetical protein